MNLEQVLPGEIEKRSFEIITEELGPRVLEPEYEAVIKRVIHTTADFDYADNLVFSDHAVNHILEALSKGTPIITDTNMGKAGINKKALSKAGSRVYCFMADEDVAEAAKNMGTTRAAASMDKAAALEAEGTSFIFAIGNAPTALIRIKELMDEGRLHPAAIIAVPVGFVNVVQAKELILSTDVPYIAARGRKGGSNVAAAIVNAILYQL